jgi:hypothetical protein
LYQLVKLILKGTSGFKKSWLAALEQSVEHLTTVLESKGSNPAFALRKEKTLVTELNLFKVEPQRQLASDGVAGPPAQVIRHPEYEGGGPDVPWP